MHFELGLPFAIISVILDSFHLAYEQWLFKRYYIDPTKLVGWEGLWGALLCSLLLILLQKIPWTYQSVWNYGYVENSSHGFAQIFTRPRLIILIVANWVGLIIYNVSLMKITKFLSWVHGCSIRKSRPVFVFVFFLFYSWNSKDEYWYLQLWALIVLILGILIFNEILVIPVFGLSYNILINRTRREYDNMNSLVDPLEN